MTAQLTISGPRIKDTNVNTSIKDKSANQPQSVWQFLVTAFWRYTDAIGESDTSSYKGLL